jgi:hypothetical protein
MNTTRTFRRLGLAAGLLLALAVPSGASASALVEADRIPEGDSGVSKNIALVDVWCDPSQLPPQERRLMEQPGAYCDFTVSYDDVMAPRWNDDATWSAPKQVRVPSGQSKIVKLVAHVRGDKYSEPHETFRVRVFENYVFIDRDLRVLAWKGDWAYDAGVILNDDRAKSIGKAKPPAFAAEAHVERYEWNDGTSAGANCLTKEAVGFKKGFGVWGYYIPGCVVTVKCPEGRECIAHAKSTLRSTGAELVTLNQRLTSTVGNFTPPFVRDTGCEGNQECTGTDDGIVIRGNGRGQAQLECKGVHAVPDYNATLVCSVDLEFVQ